MRRFVRTIVAAALATISTSGHTAWLKASSRHFVIYGDVNQKKLAQYASRLERFDSAVRFALQFADPSVGDRNRVNVYLLPSIDSIQKLAGNKEIGGFYRPSVEGPTIFVPQQLWLSDDPGVEHLFFHEYAHHLTMEDLDHPYPQWLQEGLAEFLATAQFSLDGTVVLGGADADTAMQLFHGGVVPVQVLLSGNYSKLSRDQVDASVYAEGWLLTHYLLLDDARDKLLNSYLEAIGKGEPPLDAARNSFGDLNRLQHDLNSYLERIQHALPVLKVPADRSLPGAVAVTPLSAGAAAVMPLRIRLKSGMVKASDREAFTTSVASVERQFPGDALVEETTAEAEIGAGHRDAAQAAATQALAASPHSTEALTLKGQAIELMAEDAQGDSRKTMFDQARSLFMAANKIDTEDPDALYQYYRSFAMEGTRPPDDAVAALHYASDLAPQDFSLRMSSAAAYLNANKPGDARAALAVVAFSPHVSELSALAHRMIADIDAGRSADALKDANSSAGAAKSH